MKFDYTRNAQGNSSGYVEGFVSETWSQILAGGFETLESKLNFFFFKEMIPKFLICDSKVWQLREWTIKLVILNNTFKLLFGVTYQTYMPTFNTI